MQNRDALGYMLLACKELGWTKEQAQAIYEEMYHQFDVKTENEANQLGHSWYQQLEEE